MARHLDKVWLVLLALAIGLTVACSSSTSGDDGGSSDAQSMSGG